MKPAPFRYSAPRSLDEALGILAKHGYDAKPLAGGQSLVPTMNFRLAQPGVLVDLNNIPELTFIRPDSDGSLHIGAMTRHSAVEHDPLVAQQAPLLHETMPYIAHRQIRNRGTIGGSLAHADPAAQLPLVAATLGAQIEVASVRGMRSVPAADFFVSVMTTALEADELIVSVRVPLAAAGEGAAFRLFSLRHGDFAIVSVAASVVLSGGRVERLRLGVGGAGPVPTVLADLAAAQVGRHTDAAWAAEVAADARAGLDMPDDGRIPAVYRRELTETLVARALHTALERCGVRP